MDIRRIKAVLALLTIGILGGIAPFFMKIALTRLDSYQILFLRFAIAGIVAVPLFLHRFRGVPFAKVVLLLPAGLLFTGNVFFMVVGIRYTTSIVSQLFYLLTPVLVSLIGYILFGQRVSAKRIASMAICFIGSAVLVVRSIGGAALAQSVGTPLGNILILSAVASWSCYVVYTKRISRTVAPELFLTVNFLTALAVGTAGLMLSGTPVGGTLVQFARGGLPVILSLCALGLVNSIVFFFLMQWCLRQVSAFTVAATAYLSPLSAAVFAIPFFGERLSTPLLVGAACIGIGSYLILSEQKTKH